MKAFNINWAVDMDEIMEYVGSMTCEEAASALEIPKERYENMNDEERNDYIYDMFHHHKLDKAEFMGLPDEVEIPKEVEVEFLEKDNDFDIITDYLSDTYGYCIDGDGYKTDKDNIVDIERE